MDARELELIIEAGFESRSVEFKQAGSWDDSQLRAKITRGVISLANTRDGGVLVVGMKEVSGKPGFHAVDSLSDTQKATFDPDVVVPAINAYVAPYISLTVLHHTTKSGADIVAFSVGEFRDYPVVCTKEIAGADPTKPMVRRGAILVRSLRTIETTEILSYDDLRELIELSVDKGLGTYFRRQRIQAAAQGPGDEQRFRDELGDLA